MAAVLATRRVARMTHEDVRQSERWHFGVRAALVTAAVTGCVYGPNNGAAISGPVIGQTFEYFGYTNAPGEPITLEVMVRPELDPALAASWVAFAIVVTATTPDPALGSIPEPAYSWDVEAAPIPTAAEAARWPSGGVVRTRARRGNGSVITTFDEPTFLGCIFSRFAADHDWVNAGLACAGVSNTKSGELRTTSGHVAMASTALTPLSLQIDKRPDWLGRKRDSTTADTNAYYAGWGAARTLAEFKAAYGFGGPDDITATYYNDADLGLGREMHCTRHATPKIACYVTNYSGVDNKPVFDRSAEVALADAVARSHEFATVAMVYDAGSPPSVDFVAYNKAGDRLTNAELDSVGKHTSIPSVCLSCHGISAAFHIGTATDPRYDIRDPGVTGTGVPAARFLPFDPFGFQFSTVPGFTLVEQQGALRRLNEIVLDTRPGPAIADLITGMYAPLSVHDTAAVAHDGYVPPGWANADASQDGTTMYLGVVKTGCRTCHVSASTPGLDMLELADWKAAGMLGRIRSLVCSKTSGPRGKGHDMPQAERTSQRFWNTGGRALLVTFTQSAHLPFPDPDAACTP